MSRYKDAIVGASAPPKEGPIYFWNVFLFKPTKDEMKTVGSDNTSYDKELDAVRVSRTYHDGVQAIETFFDIAHDNRDPDLLYAASWTLGEKSGDPPVLNAEWISPEYKKDPPKAPVLVTEMPPRDVPSAVPEIAMSEKDDGLVVGILAGLAGFVMAMFFKRRKRRG